MLTYDLDWAAFQLRKSAKAENRLVQRRVEKICKEMEDIKTYVMNIAEHVDFIGVCNTPEEFRRKYRDKRYCDGCGKDITAVGGWRYPQEPRRLYCTECEGKKFKERFDAKQLQIDKMNEETKRTSEREEEE